MLGFRLWRDDGSVRCQAVSRQLFCVPNYMFLFLSGIVKMFLILTNTVQCINEHYLTWQAASILTQTATRDATAEGLPLFRFVLSRVSRVLIQCIAVNIRYLSTCLNKVLEMFTFDSLTWVPSNDDLVHCALKFHKLSELMERDWRRLWDKIIWLYAALASPRRVKQAFKSRPCLTLYIRSSNGSLVTFNED